jgi:hypothetical protein
MHFKLVMSIITIPLQGKYNILIRGERKGRRIPCYNLVYPIVVRCFRYGSDSEQVPSIAMKCGHFATSPPEVPEVPSVLELDVALADSSLAYYPLLAVGPFSCSLCSVAYTVCVVADNAATPTVPIPARTNNNPMASFFITISL